MEHTVEIEISYRMVERLVREYFRAGGQGSTADIFKSLFGGKIKDNMGAYRIIYKACKKLRRGKFINDIGERSAPYYRLNQQA